MKSFDLKAEAQSSDSVLCQVVGKGYDLRFPSGSVGVATAPTDSEDAKVRKLYLY